MTTIVLNSLNYVGSGILNGASMFWERSKGIVNAFSQLSTRVNFTQDRTNVLWKLTVPVTVESDSACGCVGDVVRTTHIDIAVRLDRSATATERADILKRVRDLVASAQFGSSITSLDTPV